MKLGKFDLKHENFEKFIVDEPLIHKLLMKKLWITKLWLKFDKIRPICIWNWNLLFKKYQWKNDQLQKFDLNLTQIRPEKGKFWEIWISFIDESTINVIIKPLVQKVSMKKWTITQIWLKFDQFAYETGKIQGVILMNQRSK